MPKKIVIIGAGDLGREVLWLISDINKVQNKYEVLGFLDDNEKKFGTMLGGHKVLGGTNMVYDLNVPAVIAIQDGKLRKKIAEKLSGFDNWETIIHPSTNIAESSKIGKGCILCAGVSISIDSNIGDHCFFNLSSIIGHDCELSNYVSILSRACISGHVKIGECSYIATNSTIVPYAKVGSNSMVGAGSVVVRNVKDNVTVMGVPAKIMRF